MPSDIFNRVFGGEPPMVYSASLLMRSHDETPFAYVEANELNTLVEKTLLEARAMFRSHGGGLIDVVISENDVEKASLFLECHGDTSKVRVGRVIPRNAFRL